MEKPSEMRLKFWGVRGSIPTPTPDHLAFGGNTACIEVRSGGQLFVIDGGTGARELGLCLNQEFSQRDLKINFLLSHFHWDHIQGLPFFAPLYRSGNDVTFYSGRPAEQVRDILEGQMTNPYFPVNFEFLSASRSFIDFFGVPPKIGLVAIHPFPLNHPQGATGYRIEVDGSVITHASDLEHGNPEFDRLLREYAQNADILIYDSQYTPEEYESKKGWGHSTWLEAVQVARECRVGRLILFHHDPGHDDDCLTTIESQARGLFENTDAAREGWELSL
jgi:phosphoribosyl 1,2-cyclic phosphodiesterase